MDIISLARELGYAIQQNEDYLDYKIKEQNVECDKELQENLEKFNLKKATINLEISKQETDTQKIDKLNEEIMELYNKINSNETMMKYNEAKQKFDNTLQKVSLIINKSALGEDPYSIDVDENCTGSCSTCGGCR